MPPLATSGYGTIILRGDGGTPETFTRVAQITDINGMSLKKDTIEVTNMDSPDGWKEFIAGLKDGGEVTFGVNFLPDNGQQDGATGFIADFESDNTINYQLQWSSKVTKTWQFPSLVTAVDTGGADPSKALQAKITLKVNGKPNFLVS